MKTMTGINLSAVSMFHTLSDFSLAFSNPSVTIRGCSPCIGTKESWCL